MENYSTPESLDSTSRQLPSLVGDDDLAADMEEFLRLPQQGVEQFTQAAGTSRGVNATLPKIPSQILKKRKFPDNHYRERKKKESDTSRGVNATLPKIPSQILKERKKSYNRYRERKKMESDLQMVGKENKDLKRDIELLDLGLQARAAENQRIQWTLLLTSFMVEGLSSTFDQLSVPQKPIYALMAMLMAALGLILSIIELYYRVQERNGIIRRLLEDALANFGLFASTWQCIYSIIEYNCIKKKLNNPIKMSVLPLIFLICVAISRLCSNCRDDQISSNGQQRSHGMDASRPTTSSRHGASVSVSDGSVGRLV